MQAVGQQVPQGLACSIITYGVNSPLGRKLAEMIRDHPELYYEPLDIRQCMPRDPAGRHRLFKVSHTENGDAVRTQMAMMNDTRFYPAVLHVVNTIEQHAMAEAFTQIAHPPLPRASKPKYASS